MSRIVPAHQIIGFEIREDQEISDRPKLPERPRREPTVLPSSRTGVDVNDRDLVWLDFLARFRWATSHQLAELTKDAVKGVTARLDKLSRYEILDKHVVTKGLVLYTPTQLALGMVGSDLKPVDDITIRTIPHELSLASVARAIECDGIDSINLQPSRTVSTREILSADKAGVEGGGGHFERMQYQEELISEYGFDYDSTGAGIFVLYWGDSDGINQHVPDMVIPLKDDRGRPNGAIAVELELARKQDWRVRKTLQGYKDAGVQFNQLLWYTHSMSIGMQIKRLAREVGIDVEILKYVPRNSRQPFWG